MALCNRVARIGGEGAFECVPRAIPVAEHKERPAEHVGPAERERLRSPEAFDGFVPVLAFDVARSAFTAMPRDTVFEYYEQMQRFEESGAYDRDPGPGFTPEENSLTYNGSMWLLARRTFWADPDVPPDPTSVEYQLALEFYRVRAVGPDFRWSWSNASLEQQVFRETIRRSDDSFRRAQVHLGLLLANHLVSAVDALISSRLAAVARRPTELRTVLGPDGGAVVRLTVAF